MKQKQKVYAVRVGRQVGIFDNWDDCRASVNGFSQAEYKSFYDIADAFAYMDERFTDERNKIQLVRRLFLV